MLTLSLSTSSPQGSLALADGLQVIASETWQKQSSHSEVVTSMLSSAFEKVQKNFSQIDLLMCTHGPGSFTGLRVGLSVVRTLAQAHNIPVVDVDDTFAIALNAQTLPPEAHRLVLVDAQKNKVFAAIYKQQPPKLLTLLGPSLLDLAQVEKLLSEKSYFPLGDTAVFEKYFSTDTHKKLLSPPHISPFPNAETTLRYILQNSSDFTKKSWQQLLPLYLRASAAEEVAADKLSKKS